MVLRLIARSPREPGLIAPVVRKTSSDRELDLSVGRPGPHAFAVRSGAVRPHEQVARVALRPSQPASRPVTIGQNVPLASRRDAGIETHFSEKRNKNIFEPETGQ